MDRQVQCIIICATVFFCECRNERFAIRPHPRPTVLTVVVLRDFVLFAVHSTMHQNNMNCGFYNRHTNLKLHQNETAAITRRICGIVTRCSWFDCRCTDNSLFLKYGVVLGPTQPICTAARPDLKDRHSRNLKVIIIILIQHPGTHFNFSRRVTDRYHGKVNRIFIGLAWCQLGSELLTSRLGTGLLRPVTFVIRNVCF
jgi:hypothetical protein